MTRIAFAGPRAAGKTTLAEHLVSRHRFVRCSLAAPIKAIIARSGIASDLEAYLSEWAEDLFLDKPEQLVFVDRVARLLGYESDPGRLAQIIGTDIGRALDPQVWIRYLLDRLPEGDVVIDDVRFRNEVQALRDAGFMLVRLHASPEVIAVRLARRGTERRDPEHPSEHGLVGVPEAWWTAQWDTSEEPVEMTLARVDAIVCG